MLICVNSCLSSKTFWSLWCELIGVLYTPQHNLNCFTLAPLLQVQLLIWRKNVTSDLYAPM